MIPMSLRKRTKKNYNEDEMFQIQSTSYWKKETSKLLKIEPKDCDINDIFPNDMSLFDEMKQLLLPEWENSNWLINIDLKLLNVPNKIKTLIGKIKYIYASQSLMKEVYVDGFMDSFLHILGFDDYPCFMYPQYEYTMEMGEVEQSISAKSDFSVLTENHKMVIIIEDKTMNNASYSNNWKEDQILGELFVAIHNTVENSKNIKLTYPLNIYAIRIVGTLFTFYKTIASLEYIKESSKGFPKNTSMIVQRYPEVKDDPSGLTAYDICNKNERRNILKCMSSIRRFVSY